MLPPKMTPSLKPLRNLVGRSNTGISTGYGARSFTVRAQRAANKSSGPLRAIQDKVGTIMGAVKKLDYKADQELHQGGIRSGKSDVLYRKIIQTMHLNPQEKRATRALLGALSKAPESDNAMKTGHGEATPRQALTAKRWQQERMAAENAQPKTQSSATYYTYGDKIVKASAGQGGPTAVAGSAAEALKRSQTKPRTSTTPLESLDSNSPLSP